MASRNINERLLIRLNVHKLANCWSLLNHGMDLVHTNRWRGIVSFLHGIETAFCDQDTVGCSEVYGYASSRI